jgi:hypothetical protein
MSPLADAILGALSAPLGIAIGLGGVILKKLRRRR